MMTSPFSPPSNPRPRAAAPVAPDTLAAWLDQQARDLTHPELVADGLRRAGWFPNHAAMEAGRYRTRFNEHPLGNGALFVSTGVAALALGTVGHVLASGLNGGISRNSLGLWLTIFLVSLPFAAWAQVWANRVDREDPVAVWSLPRRSLATALVVGCAIVGIARLIWYGAQLIGTLVGATWASGDSIAGGLVNVAITICIAAPLGLWSWNFLHRFDHEDPTRPANQQRRPA